MKKIVVRVGLWVNEDGNWWERDAWYGSVWLGFERGRLNCTKRERNGKIDVLKELGVKEV